MNFCMFFTSGTHFNDTPCLSLEKKNVMFHLLFKSKKWSILIFEIQFPMFFIFLFAQSQPKMKNCHFYGCTRYPLPSSRSHGYFLHNSSMSSRVLFSLSSPRHKPHQKAFLLLTKGSGIPFLIISMVSFDTQFSIFYFHLFSTTTKKKGGPKTY